jgi:hypothetical protein
MEHGISSMKFISTILFAAFMLLAPAATVHADEQRIVIVASVGSNINAITAKEARRAYLGASIVLNGVEVTPLLNETSKLAEEVFLQKIMFMSSEAYGRQLISRQFSGARVPKIYQDITSLLEALKNDNTAITFMLYENAVNNPGIKIIGNL